MDELERTQFHHPPVDGSWRAAGGGGSVARSQEVAAVVAVVVDGAAVPPPILKRAARGLGVRAEACASVHGLPSLADGPAFALVSLDALDAVGIDAQRPLAACGIALPVVVLAQRPRAAQVVRAVRAGAFEVADLPLAPGQLREILVRAVARAREVYAAAPRVGEQRRRVGRLSPREREVLDLLLEGATTAAVAAALRISPKTVAVHRVNALRKLDARSVLAAGRLLAAAHEPRRDA